MRRLLNQTFVPLDRPPSPLIARIIIIKVAAGREYRRARVSKWFSHTLRVSPLPPVPSSLSAYDAAVDLLGAADARLAIILHTLYRPPAVVACLMPSAAASLLRVPTHSHPRRTAHTSIPFRIEFGRKGVVPGHGTDASSFPKTALVII